MTMTAHDVLRFLGLEVPARPDFPLHRVSLPTDVTPGTLSFVTSRNESLPGLFANASPEAVIIVRPSRRPQAASLPQLFVFSGNPRLTLCKLLNRFFVEPFVSGIAPTAVIRTMTPLNPQVRVADGCVITGDVTIGDRTVIEPNVTITGRVAIGADVYIKAGAVIGHKGFGFERDENGVPVPLHQFGGVRIGDRVEIGSLNTVARGTFKDTVIGDDTKMDDHVHVAHNTEIGPRCLVTAGMVFGGSVKSGSDVWFGLNATASNGIEIGDDARISLGAVVVRDVRNGESVTGNFAIDHDQFVEKNLRALLVRRED